MKRKCEIDDKLILSERISKNILSFRRSAGWSQTDLARAIGVTNPSMSLLEKGERLPSLIIARQLAAIFNMTIDELMGDSPLSHMKRFQELQAFHRRYQALDDLSDAEQGVIMALISSLKGK